ncbi:BirA family transcriptional regulator, biotin operon repressor / biotin-[acetyl-CoA-carboxylase] ligase [Hyunsoonleella jejuensis]|uniref:BirA family transcriptional regulator, biotin operon repressor / biotin-[acetyl-CoA-carboxylase] ligase n=1 Tax=Hyunsoonleella jejuensis TaxID=419940 RepID=A0A1H9J3Q8_9FLAO|nr:biotin--[acetyl-CoA-carboxylase] ligase [Hyunsoonleella jejuensis]SEQ81463.1 BirA family transcriptional regulator, biotin operon repressor / biotin-[acetyl-CoA-carboxylase] ligase [Hyunsoonleella jejuensis]
MPIIKLNAIDSTNTFLKEMINSQNVENFTVVTTKHQTKGKGQMGAQWTSEPSKNLMFSVFVDVKKIKLEYPFYISMVTALAVRQSLNSFLIPQLFIKWPNDILSQNKKICGILIENVMKQSKVYASIIGVGLNVNQMDFKNLPNASSLKQITGRVFDIDALLDVIISNLKLYVEKLQNGRFLEVKEAYESFLFRKNKPSTFKDAKGNIFSGYIKSVKESGDLEVLLEDNITKAFALKDITLMY